MSKLQQEGCIAEWSNWLKKALLVIRTELLTKDDIFNKLKVANISEPLLFSTLLDSLHFNYIKELQNQKSIDFDDMITQSISCIKKGSFSPKWDYILVDEYQDISTARMNFIRAIIDKGPKPSFTVVGDDWQAIYRFNGGKLELTTKFGEEVGPYTETTLQKTFRYNNSIAHTAGKFIMANPLQYKKFIRTNTKVDEAQVFLLDDIVGESDGVNQRLCEVLKKIRENDTQGSIAVMARYNILIKEGKEALTKEGLTNNVSFWTFHKSKGLEADYSILIGFSQGFLGFPSENKNNIVIEALLPSLEEYPHAEERRLLYVAITRAKKKCYIIADPTSPSTFITELLAPKYQINISSKKFQKTYQNIFKCPNCIEGYLKLINGPHSDFYSCSSSSGCSVGKARVCIQCGSPSIDYKGNSICNYVDCKTSIKICEKCGRVMKKRVGKYSVFWGCSGYGLKQDPCKHTVKT